MQDPGGVEHVRHCHGDIVKIDKASRPSHPHPAGVYFRFHRTNVSMDHNKDSEMPRQTRAELEALREKI